jgi:hypothetical protein
VQRLRWEGRRAVKAITLTQPWASLVALGAKKIETRSWATSYRGPLMIHAAKGLGPVGGRRGLADLVMSPPFFAALQPAMMRLRQQYNRDGDVEEWPEFAPDLLPLGAVVAVATLSDCCPITDDGIETPCGRLYPQTPEHDFGNYEPGRLAWLLADVRPLRTPVPAKGAQRLWLPHDLLELAVKEQL